MIRKSIKAFFTNGKGFFTTCGVIYLSFLVIVNSIGGILICLIKSLSQEAITEINEQVTVFFSNNPSETLIDISTFSSLLKEIFQIIYINTSQFIVIFVIIVLIGILFLSLSITYATYLCKKVIRDDLPKISSSNFWGTFVLRIISISLFLCLYALVASFWKLGIIPLILMAILSMICENLFATWLLYFRQQPLKRFLNLRNVVSLLLSFIVILLCLGVVVLASFAVFGAILSLIIILPLVTYTLAIMDTISVTYFSEKFHCDLKK